MPVNKRKTSEMNEKIPWTIVVNTNELKKFFLEMKPAGKCDCRDTSQHSYLQYSVGRFVSKTLLQQNQWMLP